MSDKVGPMTNEEEEKRKKEKELELAAAATTTTTQETTTTTMRSPKVPTTTVAYIKRWTCIVTLTLLAATHVTVYRYTRHRYAAQNATVIVDDTPRNVTIHQPHGEPYIISTSLFMAEVVKFVSCMLGLLVSSRFNLRTASSTLKGELFVGKRDTFVMIMLALLFLLKNFTVLTALSLIDAPTFQVTYQTRFIFTVVLAMIMLGMELTIVQFLALAILALGVVIIQASNNTEVSRPVVSTGLFSHETLRLIGFVITLIAAFLTSYTNVHFERILKTTEPGLNCRYIQLSLLSLLPALGFCFALDGAKILEKGFFVGYDYWVVIVIFQLAYLGFLMALVVKYADNMLRLIAVSVSVILTALMSWLFIGDFQPSWTFALGTTLVISATLLYSSPISRTSKRLRLPGCRSFETLSNSVSDKASVKTSP